MLWECITDEFTANIDGGSTKNANAIMNRWSVMLTHINKYFGYVQVIERNTVIAYISQRFSLKKPLISISIYWHITIKSKLLIFHVLFVGSCVETTLPRERKSLTQVEKMLSTTKGYFEIVKLYQNPIKELENTKLGKEDRDNLEDNCFGDSSNISRSTTAITKWP